MEDGDVEGVHQSAGRLSTSSGSCTCELKAAQAPKCPLHWILAIKSELWKPG